MTVLLKAGVLAPPLLLNGHAPELWLAGESSAHCKHSLKDSCLESPELSDYTLPGEL